MKRISIIAALALVAAACGDTKVNNTGVNAAENTVTTNVTRTVNNAQER